MSSVTTARRLPSWDDSPDKRGAASAGRQGKAGTAGGGRARARLALVAGAGVAGAALGWLVLGWIGVAAFLALFAGAFVWVVSNSGRGMLRREHAARVRPETSPRLENIVDGLAEQTGIPAPELWLIDDDEPNALVCFTKRPALAATRGLVDTYTRTELEAVVAHCYVRLAETSTPLARTLLALSYVSPAFGVPVGGADDVRAAAITRYPPALAAAITKAAPRRGRGAAFWFVAEAVAHVPPAARAEALLDL
ncbi:MAG: hypothetical protein M3217_03810 [Actinomycetota bacterium]|nr:hypothetical protein [Actinomycetota bacterium]